ncbi:MAG TPA: PQQ-binding-like beta-propeller repeat protein, partial [Caulobacteraceae bacterium]
PAFQVAWRSNAGEGSSRTSQVTSPVVAADGRIYVMDGESRVSAFDAATGAQVWRTSIRPEDGDRTAFGGGLATFGGKVFATSGFRVVAALDAATGAVAWSTPVESPIHSAPTVSAGRVYAIDVDNQLIALDVNTGALAWSSQAIVEPARILRASSPAVSGDAILAPFSSGELIALRAANGQQLWQQVLSRTNRTNALSEIRDVAGRPVISRGVAYAGSHSGLFAAVDMRTGQRKWELPIATVNAAWVAGDVVYVLSNTGQVICISRDTGQVYWIHELNENRGERRGIPGFGRRTVRPVWSGPLLANNRLILVNNEGEAVTLDARTGAEQAQINLGSAAYIAPIAYNGMVYVLTDEAKLVAIR